MGAKAAKQIFLGFVLLIPLLAFGQKRSVAQSEPKKMRAEGSLGFDHGGVQLGVEYEHPMSSGMGAGVFAFITQKKTISSLSDGYSQPGMFAISGFVRPHFTRGRWDLSLTPAFSLFTYDPALDGKSAMGYGPALGLDILYRFSRSLGFGLKQWTQYSWFSTKIPYNTQQALLVKASIAF